MIAHRLLHLLDASGFGLCGAAGLGRGHAGGDPFVGHHFHVGAHFIVKLALDLRLAEKIAQSALDAGPEFHRSPLGRF